MNRILACVASDFGKEETARELKQAIFSSEGRTIFAEVAAQTPALYPEVTSGELMAAFGADILLVKGLDVAKDEILGVPKVNGETSIQTLRKLTGTAVGINLEITDDGIESKRVTKRSIQQALALKPDFLALTGYQKPEVTKERICESITEVRSIYDGFLFVNPVLAHGRQLILEDFIEYVQKGADLLVLPASGSVPGIDEKKLSCAVEAIQKEGALVSATLSTSQEGSDEQSIRNIALSSKRAGVDAYGLGDAGVAGAAVPESLQALSIAVRGKRHTYVRMARSQNR